MKNSFAGCEKHADASFQHPFFRPINNKPKKV